MSNFNVLLDGLVLGLTLTILVGPIFIALTQTGLQKGLRAGISVGIGIWTSDILILGLIYLFLKQVGEIANHPSFTYYMGLIGGSILIGFGIYSWFKHVQWDQETKPFNAKTFSGYWTKGFLVNTINPFTFIFWISVMTNYVINKKITGWQTLLLFSTIVLTIMITDSLKVGLAKLIKSKLKGYHLDMISRVAGTLLAIFGIALMYRSGVFGR
jgi:threonine/homoserine/homoserine lactone efflux protein